MHKKIYRISHPSDQVTLACLLVISLTLLVRAFFVPGLWNDWALHTGLLAGFAAIVLLLNRYSGTSWASPIRALATISTLFILYLPLGHIPFVAIPWLADPWLAALDRSLLGGHSPLLWVAEQVTPGRLEFFAFVYAFFIPYVYLSVFFGSVGQPERERELFVTSFALTYAISFMGYLFLPARGPVVFQAHEFQSALQGGFFHNLVVTSIESAGGPHGAFPSLHVGASLLCCLFDLRYNFLRGLTYLVLVLLIAASTLVLRYHYLVDLVAGVVIAVTAISLAHRWLPWPESKNHPFPPLHTPGLVLKQWLRQFPLRIFVHHTHVEGVNGIPHGGCPLFVTNRSSLLFSRLLVKVWTGGKGQVIPMRQFHSSHLADMQWVVPVALGYLDQRWLRFAAWLHFGPSLAAREATPVKIQAALVEASRTFDEWSAHEDLRSVAELLVTQAEMPPPLDREDETPFSVVQQAGRLYRDRSMGPMIAEAHTYRRQLAHLKIQPAEIFLPLSLPRAIFFAIREVELFAVGLPLALVGAVGHAPTFLLVRLTGLALLKPGRIFGLATLVLGIQVLAISWLWSPLMGLLYGLLLAYAGLFTIVYQDRLGRAWGRTRTFFYLWRNPGIHHHLLERGRELVRMMEKEGEMP